MVEARRLPEEKCVVLFITNVWRQFITGNTHTLSFPLSLSLFLSNVICECGANKFTTPLKTVLAPITQAEMCVHAFERIFCDSHFLVVITLRAFVCCEFGLI